MCPSNQKGFSFSRLREVPVHIPPQIYNNSSQYWEKSCQIMRLPAAGRLIKQSAKKFIYP
jgi:hypothetical protein